MHYLNVILYIVLKSDFLILIDLFLLFILALFLLDYQFFECFQIYCPLSLTLRYSAEFSDLRGLHSPYVMGMSENKKDKNRYIRLEMFLNNIFKTCQH